MACNKVITKDGRTLLDLTEDDVAQGDVLQGKKFHGRDGVGKTGTLVPPTDSLAEMWEEYKKSNKTDWRNAFYNYYGQTVFSKITKEILDKLDFSGSENVTNMRSMFRSCASLTSIPLFDTSSVTDMTEMFNGCTYLASIPLLDTSKVTNMTSMFSSCMSLTTIPLLDTSNATYMNDMFNVCRALTSVPLLDMSKAQNITYMFYYCTSLTAIPALNLSNVTAMNYAFTECTALTEFHATGMKVSFDLSSSTKMSESALVEVLNNLATVTSTKTLTLGSTLLAKLTEEEKAIATQKGWTLA